MRFANTTRCFVLLLALVTTASFRGNGDAAATNSMFALAVRQTHNIQFLRVRVDEGEDAGEDICVEPAYDGLEKKDRQGIKLPLCQWVQLRKKRRCKKTIKKKKKKVFLKEHCPCTCKDVTITKGLIIEEEKGKKPGPAPDSTVLDVNDTDVSCPVIEDPQEINLSGEACFGTQICSYRYIATGCTQAEYKCVPTVSCHCTSQSIWQCMTHALFPTECEGPKTRPPPADWEVPPSNVGTTCIPEETIEETVVLRHQ